MSIEITAEKGRYSSGLPMLPVKGYFIAKKMLKAHKIKGKQRNSIDNDANE